MEKKYSVSKRIRFKIAWRTTFLQGSWNFERMQNGGWCYALIPAIRQLYPDQKEAAKALQRHLLFFNTHPYVASPIVGVALALEEEKANGALIRDEDIQAIKVGMMGPLAGVGDPVFWFTLRPLLGAIGAALAICGNPFGPILFFASWNIVRFAFMWITQEIGYQKGSNISEIFTDGLLNKVTKAASIVGLFLLGALVQRWVIVTYPSSTLQQQLDALLPGLSALFVTLFCMWLLKKKVSPVISIFLVFLLGILGHCVGIL